MQNIWVIGSNPPLIQIPIPKSVIVNNIALSKTMCYFTTNDDRLGSFSLTNDEEITPENITYESVKKVEQIVCGNEYVAYRTATGEVYARGGPFPSTFTKIKEKKEYEMPFVMSITGTPYYLFAIIPSGRFCIITGNSVIYHKKRTSDRWYIACAMFLGTVLLLGHTGRAYTMSFNEANPTLSNTLQVFSEDPCVFTSLFSCNESLFFLTNDDYVVSYGYNHRGCLGVRNMNPVSSLVRYKPSMDGETIFEIAPSSDFTFFLTQCGNVYVSGESPDNKYCTSEPVLYEPLSGKRITQIRACGNICIALEGGHKDYNSTSTPPGSYKNFPIVVMPTYYTDVLGAPKFVTPFPKNYTKWFYHPGDIIVKTDAKGKVIGLDSDNFPLIAVSNLKRIMSLTDQDNDFLDKRPGHKLIRTVTSDDKVVKIDTDDSVVSYFGGFKAGDVISTSKGETGQIIGARGEYLYVNIFSDDGSDSISAFEPRELKLESRLVPADQTTSNHIDNQSENITMKNISSQEKINADQNNENNMINKETNNDNEGNKICDKDKFLNKINAFYETLGTVENGVHCKNFIPVLIGENDRFWVLPVDEREKNDLFYLNELGLCYYIGIVNGNSFIYRKVHDSRVDYKTTNKAVLVRPYFPSEKSLKKFLTTDYKQLTNVEVSYSETIKLGFLVYDRVISPKGYATVLGAFEGKIVVMTDRNYFSASLVDIFEPTQLELVGRVDTKECKKSYKLNDDKTIELFINTGSFLDRQFLVQDRIIYNEKYGFICGKDQNKKLYMKLDNEEFVMPADKEAKRIMRYMHVMDTVLDRHFKTAYNTIMKFSGMGIKPGDYFRMKNNEPLICRGVFNNKSFLFVSLKEWMNEPDKLIGKFGKKFFMHDIRYTEIIHDWPPL
ncbi:hypothetical protein TRFO_22570 [Tritrichomonas foetus]|uniref:Uncharacterized protein n=1 Tax=Tritrichomonas foetus TaxID=1144522 RepID=A0A1J4KG94_9EUKA|nr:hypothetical protein TRFO_22570 [Tritrichomonas foetus]|eukprot:OHT08812.1 hypothetical protein TRFO_22570 [Tritrichomonas foetus]